MMLALLGCVAAGCGQGQMVETTAQIRQHLLAQDYPGALATLHQSKESGFKEQDRVVYWMNEGMILHLMGQYDTSTKALHKAEDRAKELYTKSVSKAIGAAFTSDATKDYAGEDYENVLINVIKALNFLGAGKTGGALVEARKINQKLKLYDTRYERQNVYNQDAFAHWLMGLLFEMEGSHEDARIAFTKAMMVYRGAFAKNYGIKPPPYVAEDAVRASLLSNARDIADKLRQEFGAGLGQSAAALKKSGEVVLVHLNGEGPTKSDFIVTCWFRMPSNFNKRRGFIKPPRFHCDAEPGDEFVKKVRISIPRKATVIKIAFPQLHTHAPRAQYIEISAAGSRARSSVALPLSRIATKCMADKRHNIWKDAIIRVITKTATSKAAGAVGKAVGKKAGGSGRLLSWAMEKGTSAAFQAAEEADKRAWTTLPSRIDVARLMLSPGTHTIQLRTSDGRGASIPGVVVQAGKRVIIAYRSLP